MVSLGFLAPERNLIFPSFFSVGTVTDVSFDVRRKSGCSLDDTTDQIILGDPVAHLGHRLVAEVGLGDIAKAIDIPVGLDDNSGCVLSLMKGRIIDPAHG